ncbi:unnamed protein product [Rotaria sp. Silwood2]|nr:unnamed protein product [Rotaria sp. Silwood2]
MTHNIPDNRDLSCYHVTKHSWRGKYKRIFSIGTHGISTYEPSTLGLTNAWSYDQVVSLTLSKSSNISDKSQQTLSNSSPIAEFILTFRTKSKKNDTMRFSSEYRSDIITDALRFQTLFYHQQQSLNQPKIIQATKIHWSSQRTPVLLRIQSYCIEQIDATTNRYLCSYEYKDIEQLIPLTSEGDTTVRGFLIQDKYNARLHAFVTTETSTLFQNIIDLAHTNIGVQIRLSKKSYTLNDYSQLRFGPTYVSDEHLTSFAEFIVYKHSSRHADHVRRLLCLTETCLIERDPATYHICTLKPLNEIFGLVRHKDSLQEFTIEYIRNNPTRSKCKYTSTERDILLATLLDSVRSAGNNDCCVKTNLTDRGKRFSPFGHLVDDEVEIQHLKFLVQPPSGRLSSPQDSNNPSTSQGGVSFNEILKRFNANVPYSGLINAVSSEGLFAENREKLIHSALNTLLDTDTTNNVVDLEFIEDQYLAFRRLLASKAGFQAFTQLPKFRERIGTKIVRSLKLNDDQITYSALEVLNTLLQPMHLDYDLRQEQLNKSSILSTKKFLENLLDIFLKHVKQNTGSLIISSFLDFLTYTLCPPFSETTDGQHFDVLLELVSSNGRIFFKLFQHSSFTIVKGAGSIMKAIIEEGSSDIAAHMQDLALSEGALPVHLLRALFTASNDTRLVPLKYLSQQLLGLWSTGHPTTYGLLKRIFPLGLIAYLDSSEEPDKDFGLDTKDESDSSTKNGPPNESIIRKAYFRLANKYHPDKNPNGRDMFERVNKAYEFLCAASRIQQGPNEFNIYLLLKTQSILYRRFKTLLSEYKYAGYPMLIRILETEAKNDQLFSTGNTTKPTALLPIAIELLYYTLDCSELNCEELRRENGLEILTQVFQRCSSVITKSSKSDDFVVAVCQYSALCYSVAGHFERSRDLFIDPDKLQCVLRELCHCLNYTHLKQLCTCVCKAAMSLCEGDERLRELLHRHGLFVYTCRGLFNYDYTLDESGIADSSNKQYVDNQLAYDYLQTLASLIPNNPPALMAAQTFLTPYIVTQLPDRMVLKLLNSNQEQPYLVWDNSCRQELIDKLDETRDYLVKNEYKLNVDKFGNPSEFLYTAHKTELIIGEIFVRVYNLQPTTTLKDPKKFCSDLIDFLGAGSQYINTLMAMQLQNEQQKKSNDDKKSSEGLHLDKQEHISQALEALKNVIRNNMGMETLCIGHFKLLFSLLRMENVARLQQNALELILHLSGSNECVNDISQSNVIVYLLLVLRSSISNQETTLEILNALSSNGKIVRDIVDSGGLLYLLDIFSNGQNSNLREHAANVLSKLMNDRLHGPRIRLQLIKYLPSLVVDAMRESCETSIQLYETTHENPELIWNDHTREMTCERIGKQVNEFYSQQRISPTETKWSIDDAYQLLGDDEETQRIRQNELLVGGVYVRLLIANPGWVVRRPKEFLTELLNQWTTHTKQPEQLLISHTDEFEMLTQCLIQLLHAQPTLCEHLPSIGFLPSIVQALECKSNDAIVASAIKVIFALCKSEVCLQTFSTKCPQIISGYKQAMQTRRDHLGLIAESLHDLFRTPSPGTPDEFIKEALRCQLIEHILTLLNQLLADVEKPGSCKAHLVDSCKLMAESLVYGEQVSRILQSSTVWSYYKDQRHDLFIQTSSHVQAITGGSVGPQIAGYLTSSVTSTTAGKQNTTIPPPLVDQ